MTDASNYGALSEGLRFYVAAMRSFIARTLQEQSESSDDWFEKQALETLPKPMRNSIQQRWAVQQLQRASGGGDSPEQLLDPAHFRYVINAHWDNTYEAIFEERVAIHWIGEIAYWRNVWAHAADKADVEAERILDTCERVVERFDPEATQRIERIRAGLTAAPTTDSAARQINRRCLTKRPTTAPVKPKMRKLRLVSASTSGRLACHRRCDISRLRTRRCGNL